MLSCAGACSSGVDGTAKKDDGDYSLTDGTLTIAARSRIGRIRATIRDDDVDENSETFKIQLSNPSNGAFAGDNSTIESTVTITDNDTRGVRVGPTTLKISEGWTKGYSVALESEPTGTVTVTPSVSGSSDVTVSGALTFTTGNWYRAQEVTVTAGYDADTVDDSATISHTVTGGDYGSVAADSVSVTAEDYLTTSTALILGGTSAVEESGGAQTVTVTGTLNGIPRASDTVVPVWVGTSGDSATEGTDYETVADQTLTIDAGKTTGSVSFTITPIDDDVAEGASATYTAVLDTEPTDTVTLTPGVTGSPDVTFEPSSLTFTSADWDTAQTVTLSAAEDDDAYHDSAVVSHAAEGGDYDDFTGGELTVTISDNEVQSQDSLPAQVSGLSATATATHVDLTWTAVEDTVLGYRVEVSYDRGANWAEVEDNTESTVASFRHDVGLNFAETRRYRVSAVGENGAGLPSGFLRVTATAMADGLTATARTSEDSTDSNSEDTSDSMTEGSGDSMSDDTTDATPSIDLCWIPEGVTASELSAIAVATSPVTASGSGDSGDLTWQSIGSGSSEVDCEDGIGFRTASIGSNQRYAFRMRASHAGAWLVSNVAEAVLADSSKMLRTVVTAGASGLSGDTSVPETICRDFDDPATPENEEGSFFVSIGFTTASAQYLRYEPVDGFNVESDLALANATAELVDQPHDTLLGYRVRITPRVWGSPVSISVPADVVTHGETAVGNQASGSFRRDTSDEVDCDTSAPEPARRAQVTMSQIQNDGDRDGEWTAGEPIRVTLQFDERVSVETTDGVPGVTLTLGESEAETTELSTLFSHVAHEDTLVFEHLVTADESPVRHIALVADSLALNGGQVNSVSGPAVDLAHQGAAVVDGQIEQPDLTADWSMIPDAHGGSESEFQVHLQFSEAVDLIEVIGEANLIEHAFTVTNGSIETIQHIRDRQGEYLAHEWTISVMADSEEPVTVAPVVDLACDQTGAICTVDDRLLTEARSVIVHRTEQTLSVADARVDEGPGAVLVFEVTLARPAGPWKAR